MTTKLLIALAMMQTLVLFFLCVRVLEIDTQTDELAADFAYARATASSAEVVSSGAIPQGAVGPTLAQIKAVMREEVQKIASEAKVVEVTAERQAATQVQLSRTPDEIRNIKSEIGVELKTYISAGTASEGEMASIQRKIAKLPPSEQGEMLGRLIGAMNDGRLDARL